MPPGPVIHETQQVRTDIYITYMLYSEVFVMVVDHFHAAPCAKFEEPWQSPWASVPWASNIDYPSSS